MYAPWVSRGHSLSGNVEDVSNFFNNIYAKGYWKMLTLALRPHPGFLQHVFPAGISWKISKSQECVMYIQGSSLMMYNTVYHESKDEQILCSAVVWEHASVAVVQANNQ